ncbi:MAG: phenylalanine--tRNA ligase subunit alpha [Phycisphaerales bacterium]|nr:phenylalanine--tRNA ligase subunit alpha [Phycisphaerales bacterium]
MELSPLQLDMLRRLADAPQGLLIPALAAAIGADQSPVTAACAALSDAGLIDVQSREFEDVRLTEAGQSATAAPLPERLIVDALRAAGGACRLTDLPSHCPLSQAQVGQTLRWLSERGWATKAGDQLQLTDAGKALTADPQPDEQLLQRLAGAGGASRRDELEGGSGPIDAPLKMLAARKFVTIKPRADRVARLLDAGRALLAGGVQARRTVTQLTPDLLADGGWRNVAFQPYDVTLAARTLHPGKEHPFQRTLDKVRRVFLEMGFSEIVSPWVESSFWDFDALFQPQDHPARDMQDTFYVSQPARCDLPDAALVDRIRAVHEDGGGTGSTGWRYRWRRELAHKPVLRTHTTAATIRALANHPPGSAGKYFVIGPVFRRETVDFKHLPIFHQVDGIIVDPHASLATLLGTLGAFYAKMGFPKIRFRPSFFPYTEPSAEVYLWLESRREWVEMGGSGIFRPEVTQPLGVQHRVLAWGLGLERLAMMIHGLKSIGELYFAAMPWLRGTPLSRA